MQIHFLKLKKIIFLSFLQFVTASIIDESYSSQQDIYDALLTTLFPIAFVILFNVKNDSGLIKKMLLPLLDDLLYNIVTWLIPLIVSFAYDDKLMMIFSFVNMCLHVFCAGFAIFQHKTIKDSQGK